MPHYCNETECKYWEDQECIAGKVYHVDRRCITFRRRPRGDNYRELMRPAAGICHRERGSMRRESREILK
ncbi:hypothetical protein SCACP_21490 [Sporomusa carbonis]